MPDPQRRDRVLLRRPLIAEHHCEPFIWGALASARLDHQIDRHAVDSSCLDQVNDQHIHDAPARGRRRDPPPVTPGIDALLPGGGLFVAGNAAHG